MPTETDIRVITLVIIVLPIAFSTSVMLLSELALVIRRLVS